MLIVYDLFYVHGSLAILFVDRAAVYVRMHVLARWSARDLRRGATSECAQNVHSSCICSCGEHVRWAIAGD